MARTFPSVGQSPIDAYTSGKIPASYFEFAGTITAGEEWHHNEIVCAPVLTAGSSFVGQNIVVNAIGISGSWVSGSFTKVAIDPATFVGGGYISAAEFELAISGTLQTCDFGVIVLDGAQSNTFSPVMPRGSFILINDWGDTKIPNFVRVMNQSVGSDGDTTSMFAASDSTRVSTHTLKIMVGTTPYWILCSSAQT